MKKWLAVLISVFMLVTLFSGCSSTGSKDGGGKGGEKVLTIWSFTNEAKVFATAFQEKYPDVKVEYTMIPMTEGEYQVKLRSALQSNEGPDVVALEADFVREYVESDYLIDISDLRKYADEVKTFEFTIDVGTDFDGKIKAFSYQATPGLMYYRRSLAKEYFGTDDPDKIQELMSDLEKFEQAAEVVKQKSNGNTYMILSLSDIGRVIIENRSQPWIVDNKLVIDPIVEDLFDLAKRFRQNGYEAQGDQWSESWFAGMNDSLKDAAGNPKKIFAYFLPTWGLSYVLQPNSTTSDGQSTFGDWAAIPGPLPYRWGGTWFGITKDSKNIELAKEFIKFATLTEETLKNWALGVYTNEYLKKIDPTVGDDLQQPAGDFVSSAKVVEEITSQFGNTQAAEFLGGQNPYEVFMKAAERLDISGRMKNIQATDFDVQDALWDPLAEYASGNIDKEEALRRFKEGVKNAIPNIQVD